MDRNINSFAETVNKLVNATNTALNVMVATNSAITTKDDTVSISVQDTDPITGDASTISFSIPAYNKVLNSLNSVLSTVDVFVKGQGTVQLADGSYRKIITQPIASPPDKVSGVALPTTFGVKSNWFFESMMFPQLTVSVDLKGKIDDSSDRVVVKRVILDNFNAAETQWFMDNMAGKEMSYYDATQLLSKNGKNYYEDDEVLELPLYSQAYTGYFVVMDIQTINNQEWFYLDDVKYAKTTDTPLIKNLQLSRGDLLKYNNSVWKVEEIDLNEKKIRITPSVGMDYPAINGQFYIYTVPFSTKILDIPIGYNECDMIFLKGVNDDFNVLSSSWSDSISFWTNSLILDGGVDTLESYYNRYVSDFGMQLEGQARERYIPAYYGIKPNAPRFTADNFTVSQVNNQLNAALDTNSIKNTQVQIETAKTTISSLKNTIAQQKADLVEETSPAARLDLNNKINANIQSLSAATVEYQSLVRSLSTAAYENSAVLATPKYRIRGFFEVPAGKSTDSGERPQETVQFDIAYRYLKIDGTGNALETYSYTDPSTGQKVNGVFTDWILTQTVAKQKEFDASSNSYVWVNPSISDGNEVNINQVDIPIQRGEKVQIKIRSISEAGWPYNPIKSEWSDAVIVNFPTNLESSDQIVNILTDAQSEETAIKLNETLSSSGVTSHLSDSIPNPNQGSGTYFKHQSEGIALKKREKNVEGTILQERTIDLQSYLDDLATNEYITVKDTTGKSYTTSVTKIVQEILRAMDTNTPIDYWGLTL